MPGSPRRTGMLPATPHPEGARPGWALALSSSRAPPPHQASGQTEDLTSVSKTTTCFQTPLWAWVGGYGGGR